MYKHLFGPVPSRRLGSSLGIDLVPKKVCSLNCVYCEVGKTTKLTLERKEYVPYDKIIDELDHFFENNPDPDYFTFSGSGEPTLNINIGEIIQFLKRKKPEIPVAVLTNGTLMQYKSVRDELLNADLVLPSLDAVSEDVFNKINQPADGLLIENYTEGLIRFAKDFTGKIWLEIFILPGYNDSEDELKKFKKVLQQINPDKIQLNTLDRPGIYDSLIPAAYEELIAVKNILDTENIEIISSVKNRTETHSYNRNTEQVILQTISRRPCTLDDLQHLTGKHVNELNKYLNVLEADNKIVTSRQKRGIFYRIKDHG